MHNLLQDLAESKLVKVTGSFAVGKQTDESDIDFFIVPDDPDTPFNQRNMIKVIEILKRHRIKW